MSPDSVTSTWCQILSQSISDLDGNKVFVRGAKLRDHVEVLGRQRGLDLAEYLTSTQQKFGQFVESCPGVEVHKRPGTDMFVGLDGAEWPDPPGHFPDTTLHGSTRFRPDVYAALTQISEMPYYYVPTRDLFTQQIQPGNDESSKQLPSVTLTDLLNQRRDFANQVADEKSKSELLASIAQPSNQLVGFQQALARLRLRSAWHQFNFKILRANLEKWCEDNGVPFSPTWLSEGDDASVPDSPQQLISRISQYMTDDEIRSIQIPFRALEAMYRDLMTKRR